MIRLDFIEHDPRHRRDEWAHARCPGRPWHGRWLCSRNSRERNHLGDDRQQRDLTTRRRARRKWSRERERERRARWRRRLGRRYHHIRRIVRQHLIEHNQRPRGWPRWGRRGILGADGQRRERREWRKRRRGRNDPLSNICGLVVQPRLEHCGRVGRRRRPDGRRDRVHRERRRRRRRPRIPDSSSDERGFELEYGAITPGRLRREQFRSSRGLGREWRPGGRLLGLRSGRERFHPRQHVRAAAAGSQRVPAAMPRACLRSATGIPSTCLHCSGMTSRS